MKNYHILMLGVCCVLSACISVNYLGDRLAPTTSVDVYYSAHDVKPDYKVIGHLSCPNSGTKMVRSTLISYAKKIGADAIIISGTQAIADNQNGVVNADALKYKSR